MQRRLRPGEHLRVWVYLKNNGKNVDEHPHLIETHVTNGWSTWFSRNVKTAVCGKAKRHREGWRGALQYDKLNQVEPVGIPDNPCPDCYNVSLVYELGE